MSGRFSDRGHGGRAPQQHGGRSAARGGHNNGRHFAAGGAPGAPAQARSTSPTIDPIMSFLAMTLLGKTVSIETADEQTYEGLFHTFKQSGKDLHIVLKYSKLVSKGGAAVEHRTVKPSDTRVIFSKDIVCMEAKEVKLGAEDIVQLKTRDEAFLADSEISGGRSMQQRELQAFVFDGSSATGGGLEDGVTGWSGEDMFKQNQLKFGVESRFDESRYTTALDKTNATITEEEAARIERRILTQNTADRHVREERGFEDDDGLDEEQRYGAVLRQPEATSGRGRGPAWGGRGTGASALGRGGAAGSRPPSGPGKADSQAPAPRHVQQPDAKTAPQEVLSGFDGCAASASRAAVHGIHDHSRSSRATGSFTRGRAASCVQQRRYWGTSCKFQCRCY